MEEKGVENVNIREILLEMRTCRMGLIQTHDQLKFSYIAIIQGLKVDWNACNNVNVIHYYWNGFISKIHRKLIVWIYRVFSRMVYLRMSYLSMVTVTPRTNHRHCRLQEMRPSRRPKNRCLALQSIRLKTQILISRSVAIAAKAAKMKREWRD